jgi:uroporphyrin-III C-methyltransferase
MPEKHPKDMRNETDDLALPQIEPGWVWLVGAGPGDPGLLTLLGLAALRSADVIVYDALVSDAVLALASPETERVFAGKRGGRPSADQQDISRKLVELAKDGRRVLRLKGGDPCIFGRGGEEAQTLAQASVPFRMVPGITAGIGGLAYAGIPATHRDTNTAITFITGHASDGHVPDNLNWEALAKSAQVLVLYMALGHIEHITKLLMDAGRDTDEPVCVISNATLANQKVLDTTLINAAADIKKAAMKPPAVVVIGANVGLRAPLDWIGALGDWQNTP